MPALQGSARASTSSFSPLSRPSARLHSSRNVATSTSPRTAETDQNDINTIASATLNRYALNTSTSSLSAKLAQIELLLSPETSLDIFRAAAPILDATSYVELLEERHMEKLCPYAPCGNPPGRDYNPTETSASGSTKNSSSSLRVQMKSDGKLYQAVEDSKGNYCSRKCKLRSSWYQEKCVGRENVELLEDLDERREQVRQSMKIDPISEQTASETGGNSSTASENESQQFSNALVPGLVITERDTGNVAAVAPTISSAAIDFERPLNSTNSAQSTQFPLNQSKPIKPTHAALTPFDTTSLSRTLLQTATSPPASASIRQPSQGWEGLPPPVFLTEPRMLDVSGMEVDWPEEPVAENDDQVKIWLNEALEIRQQMREGKL